MLLNLLTIGSACAMGAFLISLRMGHRDRIRQSGALFVAMLGLLLARLYPAWEWLFSAIAIGAALAYAVPTVRDLLAGRTDHNDHDD
ncbi:hypothetical protein V5738_10410 [Salinisphaera sp. SPP-AMP-43]|uniref:hypothetical protein n=1 Tax=Salinisphaera sp. SPP-AMP-43 TaxID=3121288 RepID=UPI003C6DD300